MGHPTEATIGSQNMAIHDLFSKRQRRARGEVPDVFSYAPIPHAFRVQVLHIWDEAFGNDSRYGNDKAMMFSGMRTLIAKEYGTYILSRHGQYATAEEDLRQFLLETQETEKVLDIIEVSFKAALGLTHRYHSYAEPRITAKEAVEDLNTRFREHGLGYRFEDEQLIKVDTEFTHKEMIQPALVVLGDKEFAGADEEFRKAHDHYLHNRIKESLAEASKAFESTMKTICRKRGWTLSGKETAKTLIEICAEKGLFPNFLLSHYSALIATLESGVPTIRNKLGGHGQGDQVVDVPPHFAAYQLHLTASAILFLVQSHKNLP